MDSESAQLQKANCIQCPRPIARTTRNFYQEAVNLLLGSGRPLLTRSGGSQIVTRLSWPAIAFTSGFWITPKPRRQEVAEDEKA